MTSQPFRIIRAPRDADLPPASRLGAAAVPSSALSCPTCHVYVADLSAHLAYHDRLDRWVRRVGEVVRILLRHLIRRGDIPLDLPSVDDTIPTSGDNQQGEPQ